MLQAAAVALALATSFQSSIEPLPQPVRERLKAGDYWQRGCPVGLGDLRLLTVSHRGWRGRTRQGQLIVNETAAPRLRVAFRRLYALHFPIRHMRLRDYYGPGPARDDVTASFHCRQAAASPCTGRRRTGTWSNHAYGLAVDVNPRENPYVGCGMSRDRTARAYRDRTRHRKGMVTPRAVQAFASVGWSWGGAWTGNTKDYMHFSVDGR